MAAAPTKTGRSMVPVSLDATLEAFTAMVSAIPGPEEGNAEANLARILSATSWDEIGEDADGLPSGRDLAGKTVIVERVVRHVSTLGEGPGWYLVADAIDTATGERFKFQTSAGELLAVLVKLHYSEAFPARLVIRTAKTSKGHDVVKVSVDGANADPRPLAV